MNTTVEQKKELLDYWNDKKIIVHRRMTPDIERELGKALRSYTAEEIKGFVDLYATILEPEVAEENKKYFWTYRWNLSEFLSRGLKKFDGQEAKNYLRKQNVGVSKSIIHKR